MPAGITGRGGRLLLLGLAACAVGAALLLPRLRFDHNTRSLLKGDAREDAREADLARTFGSEDLLLVAWEVKGVLDPGEFARLREVAHELARIPGLEQTYSLAAPMVQFRIGGELRPLGPQDFATSEARARAREALLAPNPYVGTIYNPALDVVAVAGTLVPGPQEDRRATLRAVRAVAAAHGEPGRPLHVAGVTALAVDASEYALRDLEEIGGTALIVSVLVLFVLCRSIKETAIAIGTTGLPPLFALAAAVLLDLPVTALGAALFPVLAVVGITGSVHLLNAYAEERQDGAGAPEAARAAAARLRWPIALSLVTTAAAFASLAWTGVPAFSAGGQIVALGMLVAIPVLLLGLPAALAWSAPRARDSAARRLDAPLVRLAQWTVRRRLAIAVAGAAACAAGVALTAGAKVRVDVLQAFQPESRIARTYTFLEERLTATVPTDAVLDARADAPMDAILADLSSFGVEARAEPAVSSAMSLADLVRYGQRVSPVPVNEAGALLVLRSPVFAAITRRFEDPAAHRYRVKMRLRDGAPPAVLDRLQAIAARRTTGRMEIVGLYVRAVETTRTLIANLAAGAVLMGVVVMVASGLALRSWRAGVAALLPNLMPPAVVFGAAALLGVRLDVSAVAVGAVAIGLAVDDTLHVLFRVRYERRRGRDLDGALVEAQRHVGRALVFSTAVLTAGLLCLGLSAFLPTARFGLFTALCCLAALPGDLLLLPALLRLLRAL